MAKRRKAIDPEQEEVEEADHSVKGEKEEEDSDAKQKRRRKRKRKRKEGASNDDDNKDDDDDDAAEPEADGNEKAVELTKEDQKKAEEVERTIYMEGIPFSCTEENVREFFHSNGLKELTDVRLPVWQDSGRLRGYGHIVFPTVKDQKLALTLNKKYMEKRYVTIQAAQAPKAACTTVEPNRNPSRTLILNNLSYDATEEEIFAVMEKYGKIVEGGVRVVRHSDTGRSKGFAYVEFETQNTAIQVVKDGHVTICSRPCRIDYDHGRVRASFRTADRKLWIKENKR